MYVPLKKGNLIKQKQEIAASHHPWKSNFFLKLPWFEKMFKNTPSLVMTGTYIQPYITKTD